MAKLDSYQLAHFEDGDLSAVELEDFEVMSYEGAEKAIKEVFRVLRDGGTLEFLVLNWQWCIKQAVGQKLVDVLSSHFGSRYRSIWDEHGLLRLLFQAGFLKIWTGHVAEYPEHILLVKALKFQPTEVEVLL